MLDLVARTTFTLDVPYTYETVTRMELLFKGVYQQEKVFIHVFRRKGTVRLMVLDGPNSRAAKLAREIARTHGIEIVSESPAPLRLVT